MWNLKLYDDVNYANADNVFWILLKMLCTFHACWPVIQYQMLFVFRDSENAPSILSAKFETSETIITTSV